MNAVTHIVARHQVLVALCEAGKDGLEEAELMRRVLQAPECKAEGLAEKALKQEILRMSHGALGSGPREIFKKKGRWCTHRLRPPAPITVSTAPPDAAPERDPELVREDEERAALDALEAARPAPPAGEDRVAKKIEKKKASPSERVLELMEGAKDWLRQDVIQSKVGYGAKPAIDALVKAGQISVAGAGRARLLSLAKLKLKAPEGAAPARTLPKRDGSSGPLQDAADALDAEIEQLEQQGKELEATLKGRRSAREALGKLIEKFA